MDQIKKLIADKILEDYKILLSKMLDDADINIKGNRILVIFSDNTEYSIEI
jgi:hypothetical protein